MTVSSALGTVLGLRQTCPCLLDPSVCRATICHDSCPRRRPTRALEACGRGKTGQRGSRTGVACDLGQKRSTLQSGEGIGCEGAGGLEDPTRLEAGQSHWTCGPHGGGRMLA